MRLPWLLGVLAVVPQEDYLPLKEGARWTYTVEERTAEASPGVRESVAEVGGTKTIGESEWTELRHFLGYSSCYLRVSASAIELKIEATDQSPALTLLKLPARQGETWTGQFGREEVKFATDAEERVELDGSSVRALRVSFTIAQLERHAGHAPTRGDLWFTAGLGIVKAQVTKDLDCHSAETKVFRLKM